MISVKKCGSCKYFFGFKHTWTPGFSGICDYYDSRCKSGDKKCKHWKGIKYERKGKHSYKIDISGNDYE